MNILLLGSGGREHAFAWKISQSPRCSQLFVAPGNPGTADIAINVPLGVTDFVGIHEFIKSNVNGIKTFRYYSKRPYTIIKNHIYTCLYYIDNICVGSR